MLKVLSSPPIKIEVRESTLGLIPKWASTWAAKSGSLLFCISLYFCKAVAERRAEILREFEPSTDKLPCNPTKVRPVEVVETLETYDNGIYLPSGAYIINTSIDMGTTVTFSGWVKIVSDVASGMIFGFGSIS